MTDNGKMASFVISPINALFQNHIQQLIGVMKIILQDRMANRPADNLAL